MLSEVDAATSAYMAAAEESLARVIIAERRKQDTGLINSISAKLQDLSHDVLQLHNSTSFDDLMPRLPIPTAAGIPPVSSVLSPREGIWNNRQEVVEPFPFFAPLASPPTAVPTFDYLASPRPASTPTVTSPRVGRRPMSPLPPPATTAAMVSPELLVLPPSSCTAVGVADDGIRHLHNLFQSPVAFTPPEYESHSDNFIQQPVAPSPSLPPPPVPTTTLPLSVPAPTVVPKAASGEVGVPLSTREDSFSGALAPANSLVFQQQHQQPQQTVQSSKQRSDSIVKSNINPSNTNPVNTMSNEDVATMAQVLQLQNHPSTTSTDTSLPAPSVPMINPDSDVANALQKLAVVLGCTPKGSENDDIPQIPVQHNPDMLEQLAKAIYSESRKLEGSEKFHSNFSVSKSLN